MLQTRCFLIIEIAWLLAAGAGAAQQPASSTGERPRLMLNAPGETPSIDGRLDDPAWETAPLLTGFTQVEPVEGAAPSEPTQVRILYDKDALFIGIRCFDSQPGLIVAKQMRWDADLSSDDVVRVSLDPLFDRRNGYYFEMGPAGARRDALIENNSNLRFEWDGLWFGKAAVDSRGWSAELSIPFKTLSFTRSASTWGFNVERIIRRRNEVIRWAAPVRQSNLRVVADAGLIEGLDGIGQGIGVSIKPFLTTTLDTGQDALKIDPGVDVFYQVTSSITAAVTLNTDFAETDVDARRVNLTRFPLFFPEKRDFFLQDAGLFSFGSIYSSPLPFFSRRIGIVSGEEKGILAGLKLTGRTGPLRFGLLDVQMDEDETLGNKNLLVARASYDILRESNLGVIFTRGEPGGDGANRLVGADFNFRTGSFLGDKVFQGHAWAQVSRSENTGTGVSTDAAFGGRIDFPNDPVEFYLFLDQVGEEFDPGLGFVARPGEREIVAAGGYLIRPRGGTGFIRTLRLSSNASLFTDLDGTITTAEWTLLQVNVGSARGDSLELFFNANRENLETPFNIIDDIIVPAGRYDTKRVGLSLASASSRAVAGFIHLGRSGFFSGTRTDLIGSLTWRPSARYLANVEYERNNVDLEQGSFTVQIARAGLDVLFSPDLSWSTITQWDSNTETIGLNSRVRWEVRPGHILYLVYNDGFKGGQDQGSFTDSAISFKAGMTFRY